LKKITGQEFVRRLKDATANGEIATKKDSRFAFFLGAGCSVSSGIPAAGDLVRQWLPRLKKLEMGDDSGPEEWAQERYQGYSSDTAARYYGQVIEDLFITPQSRQHEIERLVMGKYPGFGYAVLAQLISCGTYGEHCNVVLTTNFDDLVADAMYLYANRKPLAIVHESLAGFVMVSRTSPVVIKLHGDARLAPRNTQAETKELDDQIRRSVVSILQETGIIIIGYGQR
jgi:hypothetical protein